MENKENKNRNRSKIKNDGSNPPMTGSADWRSTWDQGQKTYTTTRGDETAGSSVCNGQPGKYTSWWSGFRLTACSKLVPEKIVTMLHLDMQLSFSPIKILCVDRSKSFKKQKITHPHFWI